MNKQATPEAAEAVAPTHKNIASALAAAQAEMGRAIKDSANPAFKSKYADLASVMDACMSALTRNGIAVIQPTVDDEFGRFVETRLIHGATGEALSCRVPLIVGKNDMQGYGSAVTYARRYGLMCMAGVAPEDDDGNAAAKSVAAAKAGNPMGEAIHDAWTQSVLDGLPENASDAEKARAFKDAIIADFADKGEKALGNAWQRHSKLIQGMGRRFPEFYQEIEAAFDEAGERASARAAQTE